MYDSPSSNPNPLPNHGTLWFDARPYGVSPSNSDNGPNLQKAFNDAHAAVVAATTSAGTPMATVYVPAGKYTIKTPVFIAGGDIRLLGEGNATQFVGVPQNGSTIFCVGMSDVGTPNPNPVGSSFRPDLYGKLDTSVVTATGQKWGFSGGPNGDCYIIASLSPFSHGRLNPVDAIPAGWFIEDSITIDFAIEAADSGEIPSGQVILGMGTSNEITYPFSLTTNGNNSFQLCVSTQSSQFATPVNSTCSFSTGTATGVQKISIQISPKNGTVQVYAATGGAATATQLSVTGSMPPANSYFNENIYFPFCVNYDNYDAHGIGSAPGGGKWNLYGLNISQGLRYADRGAGQLQIANPQVTWSSGGATPTFMISIPGNATGGTYTVTINGQTATLSPTATAAQMTTAMTNIGLSVSSVGGPTLYTAGNTINYQIALSSGSVDTNPGMCDGTNLTGQVLNDTYRYFPSFGYFPNCIDYYSIGYFPFTENPSGTPRTIAIQGGWRTAGNVTAEAQLINPGALGTTAFRNRFENFSVAQGQFSSYGTTILIGNVLDTTFERVTATGGMTAIASHPFGATYTVTLRDCSIGGGFASAYLYWTDIKFYDTLVPVMYKFCIISVGSDVLTSGLFVRQYSNSIYSVIQSFCDAYGGTYIHENTKCDFEGDITPKRGLFYFEPTAITTVRINDVYGGGIGDAPMIYLNSYGGGPPGTLAAYINADNIQASTTWGVVHCQNKLWNGQITNAISSSSSILDSNYVTGDLVDERPIVKVIDSYSSTFPRKGNHAWRRDTTDILVQAPSDGHYKKMILQGDGTHGSSTPPRWKGRDADQLSSASAASYAIDHTAISATIDGNASYQGFLTETAAKAVAGCLFSGNTLGTSTYLVISATGGTFALTYGGQTATIAATATAATIQSTLEGLSTIGTGNIQVSSVRPGVFAIAFAGSLAKTAGAANNLSLNPASLTGGGAAIGSYATLTVPTSTGGSFALSFLGQTATINYSSTLTAAQVQSSLQALTTATTNGVSVLGNTAGPFVIGINGQGATAAGLIGSGANLTGNSGSLSISLTSPSYDLPRTWYVGLLTRFGGRTNAAHEVSGGNYQRANIASTTAAFGASSSGVKTSGAAITFPSATVAYKYTGIALYPSVESTTPWAVINLANPVSVAVGHAPTIPIGDLVFTHTPYVGDFSGCLSDYGWGKCYDLLFGSVSFAVPSWYLALGTSSVTKASTSIGEPSTNGYARLSMPQSSWYVSQIYSSSNKDYRYQNQSEIRNSSQVSFATPTGSLGNCLSFGVADASTSGNLWFVAPLVNPITPSQTNVPSFDTGSIIMAIA